VHWWDTAHDRAETTELAPHTVTVLPAVGSKGAAPSPSTPGAPAAAETATAHSPSQAPQHAVPVVMPQASRLWQIAAVTGFALWLATLALWWRSRRVALPAQPASTPGESASSAPRAAFLRACALGELAGAERALVAWARSERPDVRNLGELSMRLDDTAQTDALAALQRARYAGGATNGVGTALERAFKPGLAWRTPASPAKLKSALPALYPD
jgi:hypothetical protein